MKKEILKTDAISANEELLSQISQLKLEKLEQTEKIDQLSRELADLKLKESSISSALICAIEKARQLEENSKKLYQIEIQRLRAIYLKMENTISELNRMHPELTNNKKFADISQQFKDAIIKEFEKDECALSSSFNFFASLPDDPIRQILAKITQNFEKSDKKENLARKDKTENITEENEQTDVKNAKIKQKNLPFDFNEALNPTLSLEDILKDLNLGKDFK